MSVVNKQLARFIKEPLAVTCHTEEEAVALMKIFREGDLTFNRWGLASPINHHWDIFKEHTCYYHEGVYIWVVHQDTEKIKDYMFISFEEFKLLYNKYRMMQIVREGLGMSPEDTFYINGDKTEIYQITDENLVVQYPAISNEVFNQPQKLGDLLTGSSSFEVIRKEK